MERPNQKRGRIAATSALLLSILTLALPGFAAPWVQTTSLPDNWGYHSLVYASGHLYNIGGSSDSNGDADGTNVFCAQVHSDGTIGAWTNTTSLPIAVLNHSSVAANGFVYVFGGYHYDAGLSPYDISSDIVYFSRINTNGTLGSWQTANPLPNNLSTYTSSSVWNNRIYVIGGLDYNSNPQNGVYSAQIQPDGSLSAWTTQPSVPVPGGPDGAGIYLHASVANGFLYVLGGLINGGSQVINAVYYSKINSDGSLAGWNQATPMPQPLSFFGAIIANGQVFAMGGDNGGSFVNAFYNAAVMGDGSLNSWSAGTTLPQAMDAFGAADNGSNIFISGGFSVSSASREVYSMALPVPPATPTLGAGRLTNGNFQLQLASTTNTGFGLLASTNLTTWTNIGWGFTGTNGTLLFQDTKAASFPNRFYRAYWPLP